MDGGAILASESSTKGTLYPESVVRLSDDTDEECLSGAVRIRSDRCSSLFPDTEASSYK